MPESCSPHDSAARKTPLPGGGQGARTGGPPARAASPGPDAAAVPPVPRRSPGNLHPPARGNPRFPSPPPRGEGERDSASPPEPPGAGSVGEPEPPGGARRQTAPPGGTTGREWEIALPPGLPLLNLNDRDHWAAKNRKARALKDAAIVMARKAKLPPLDRIAVTVVYDPPDGRHRDPDNIVVKPLIDGLAMVILPSYGKRRPVPGDDSRHVARVSSEIGPEPYPRGRLRMIITEVAERDAA